MILLGLTSLILLGVSDELHAGAAIWDDFFEEIIEITPELLEHLQQDIIVLLVDVNNEIIPVVLTLSDLFQPFSELSDLVVKCFLLFKEDPVLGCEVLLILFDVVELPHEPGDLDVHVLLHFGLILDMDI